MLIPDLETIYFQRLVPLFHFPNKANIFLAGGNFGFTLRGKWVISCIGEKWHSIWSAATRIFCEV